MIALDLTVQSVAPWVVSVSASRTSSTASAIAVRLARTASVRVDVASVNVTTWAVRTTFVKP